MNLRPISRKLPKDSGIYSKKLAATFLLISVLNMISGCGTPKSAAIEPKVGECYVISQTAFDASSPESSAVKCVDVHNSETYRVGRWVNNKSPFELSQSEIHNAAESVCLPWNLPTNTFLNYWIFFFPTKEDWTKGSHWIRCDAMLVNKDARGNRIFGSWKGSKTSLGIQLQQDELIPAGQEIYVYLEPNGEGCLGSGNVRAGNTVVLVETDPQKDPRMQPELARSQIYSREGACGLGVKFVLNTSQHSSLGTVYDKTSDRILGNVELIVEGNTIIFLDGVFNPVPVKTKKSASTSNSGVSDNPVLQKSAVNYFLPGTALSTLVQVWGISLIDSNGPKTIQQVSDEIYAYLCRSVGNKVTADDLEISFQPGNAMYIFFTRLIDNIFVYQVVKDRLIYDAQHL